MKATLWITTGKEAGASPSFHGGVIIPPSIGTMLPLCETLRVRHYSTTHTQLVGG